MIKAVTLAKTGLLTLCLALAVGAMASAQVLPQLFAVQDVAADDVLNIRQEPSARSDIIGGFAPDARNIEVIALNATRRWGLINHEEGTGWVSMRYLRAQGRSIDHYNMPQGLRCFGTEPFWSAISQGGMLRYEALGAAPVMLEIEIAQDSGLGDDLRRMIQMRGPDGMASAYIYPAQCSDGMSDRAYGLSVALMTGPSAPLLLGCCSLARQDAAQPSAQ